MSLNASGWVAQSSKPCCVIDALSARPRFAMSKKQWSWGIVVLANCLSCLLSRLFVVKSAVCCKKLVNMR